MKRRTILSVILAVAVLAVSPVSATIHEVEVGNFFFSPTKTTVSPGDTVRWVLVGGFHTTTSEGTSPKVWDSGNLSSVGGTFDVVFTAGDGPGPFPYLCSFHPGSMKDTIFMAAAAEPTNYVFTLDGDQANSGSGTGSLATGCAALRDELDARRTARAARKQLERELASYSTHRERMELDALIDQSGAPDAEYVRSLLHRTPVA